MARPRLVAGCVVLALACGGLFTGCASQDAAPVAGQACAHVDRALTAEHRATSAGTGQAAHLESEALDQVRAALPLAARVVSPGRLHSARVIATLLVVFYVAFAPIGIDNYLYLPAVATLLVVIVLSNRERWREIRSRGGAGR